MTDVRITERIDSNTMELVIRTEFDGKKLTNHLINKIEELLNETLQEMAEKIFKQNETRIIAQIEMGEISKLAIMNVAAAIAQRFLEQPKKKD